MDVVEQRTWTDEELAALYDSFFAPVFDVAVRVLGSDDEAGAAAERTLSRALAELRRGRPVAELRPWLYGLLAAELPRRLAAPASDSRRFADVDPDRLANPERLGRDGHAGDAVWAAVSSLPTEDYLLLDLQLRHGLRDPELGRALRLDLRVLDSRLERLRNRLEDAAESPVSPVAVFAALAPVPAPTGLKEKVWASIASGPAPRPRRDRKRALPRKPVVLAAAIALFAAAATAGAFYAARGKGVHDPTAVHSTSHRVEQGSANPDVEVEWTPSRDASGYSVSWSAKPETPDKTLDLPAAATGTTGHLKPGTSWFNLRTLGKNGRWTGTVHVGPFLILPDTVVPETTITAGPQKYGTAIATFEFESNEKSAVLECSFDGAKFESCASPKSFTRLARGSHSFRVRAVDAAGNTDPTPARREWQVDAKAPATELTEFPDEFTHVDARFEFASSEERSSFECKLDEGRFAACSSPKTYRGLDDGQHRFRVRAVDHAGNKDGSPASRKWTVDTKPPETTVDSGPNGVSHKGAATFSVSSEAGASFECRLDGDEWGDCGPISGLEDGKHVLKARAKDRAGNADPTPAAWRWRVDLPPDTTITGGPRGPAKATSATFQFSSNDSSASFQCRLDAGGWSACSSGKTYSSLSQGQHTFRVRAKDANGTKDRSPAKRTWKVDTVAPNTTITSGPKTSTGSKSATFAFSGSESGVTFECSLDGGAWRACSSPRTYSGLKNGSHVFRVRAVDEAGNADKSPAARSWTVH
jgi:DNA-directed RNA polymerase specialized sigma24 family protein